MADGWVSRLRAPRRRGALLAGAVALVVAGAAGCGGGGGTAASPPSPTAVASTGAPGSPSGNPYANYDQQVRSLLRAVATWSTPKHSVADRTERIGLSFGSIAALKPQIDQLIPQAVRSEAGAYDVGPTMTVELSADPNDADIAAPTVLNRSTGSNVHYLFTWQVRPLHPARAMLFTAKVTIPLSNGHTDSYDIGLSLRVDRTFAYTAHQIFASWATWLSIVTVLGGAGAWLWRRRVRLRRLGQAPHRPARPKARRVSR